jgi:hypothetical protein
MRFRIRWKRAARGRLADAWLNAPDRNAVTEASARIELLLQTDPLHVGESRLGTDRILFISPLVVHYTVILDDQKVVILDVQHV